MRFLLLLAALVAAAAAHQSLAKISMSNTKICRVSTDPPHDCPGPCPTMPELLRKDVSKTNPQIIAGRGETVTIKTLRNNHVGGFGRWTAVHVKDINDRNKHAANAFRFDCADAGETKCDERVKQRDCFADKENSTYSHKVTIPTVMADGVYILGWVWFAGVNLNGFNGVFGDYHDCSFLEVKGGVPLTETYTPVFDTSGSKTAGNGTCLATTTAVGDCPEEPCKPRPGSPFSSKARQLKPRLFDNGPPKPLTPEMFKDPYQIPKANATVKSMTIWQLNDGKLARKLWRTGQSEASRSPFLPLTRNMSLTITCEVDGDVDMVYFVVNGKHNKPDFEAPYSVALDWVNFADKKPRYAPWPFNIDGNFVTVACWAIDKNNNDSWMTMEITSSAPKK